jgi:bacterial/archaeal transporter family protein
MAMMTRSFSADGLKFLRNTKDFIPPRELTPLIGQQQQLEIYKNNNSSFTQLQSSGPRLALWITPALLCGLSYGTCCCCCCCLLSQHGTLGALDSLTRLSMSLLILITCHIQYKQQLTHSLTHLLLDTPLALYNIFIKLGSYSIHPVLGGVVLQFVAALLGLVLLTLQMTQSDPSQEEQQEPFYPATTTTPTPTITTSNKHPHYDRPGIFWSVCAGVAVGIAEMLSFLVSSMGVPAVHSIPVIIGGSVLFGTLLGFILLQENLSPRGWFGVLLLVGGITLVGTD